MVVGGMPSVVIPIVMIVVIVIRTMAVFHFVAAIGFDRCVNDRVCLLVCEQAVQPKLHNLCRDGEDILVMVFPALARTWSRTRRELIDAAPFRIDDGPWRRIRASIQGIRNTIAIGIGLA